MPFKRTGLFKLRVIQLYRIYYTVKRITRYGGGDRWNINIGIYTMIQDLHK